jgi:hypothetical protein
VAKDEYMTGDLDTLDPAYSVLTFALFEDTGWYTVDWAWATPMNFGRDKGCAFHTDKCIADDKAAQFEEFCTDTTSRTRCDYNHLYVGSCGISTESFFYVEKEFNYFGDTHK